MCRFKFCLNRLHLLMGNYLPFLRMQLDISVIGFQILQRMQISPVLSCSMLLGSRPFKAKQCFPLSLYPATLKNPHSVLPLQIIP